MTSAAAFRLLTFYNTNIYSAATNPGGLDGKDGMGTNYLAVAADVGQVGKEVAEATGSIGIAARYTFDAGTTDADPGAGEIRLNAASVGSATYIYASTSDAGGEDVSAFLAAMDDSTNPTIKALVGIRHLTDPTKWAIFLLTGEVVAATGYRKLLVSHLSGPGGFGAGDAVALGFQPVGNAGATGATGGIVGGNLTGALNETAVTIASAGTTDLGGAAGNAVTVTGTTTITALGTAQSGAERTVTFSGALTLTHNATSLILPGGANIVTAAGDVARFRSLGSGNWRCVGYTRATGKPLVPNTPAEVGAIGQGKHTLAVLAGGMLGEAVNGASGALVSTTVNKQRYGVMQFDPAVTEYADFLVPMPASWNEGTLTAQFYWRHGATTTNFGVVWGIHAVAVGDSDPIDAAWGTAIAKADTGGVAGTLYISDETAAITVGGSPQAGDLVMFRVYRSVDNAADTLAIDADLIAVQIFLTINAPTD